MLSVSIDEPVSDQVIQMIITYVIAKTYWKAGAIWEKGAS